MTSYGSDAGVVTFYGDYLCVDCTTPICPNNMGGHRTQSILPNLSPKSPGLQALHFLILSFCQLNKAQVSFAPHVLLFEELGRSCSIS